MGVADAARVAHARALVQGRPDAALHTRAPVPAARGGCPLHTTEAPKFSSRKTKADLEGMTEQDQVRCARARVRVCLAPNSVPDATTRLAVPTCRHTD